MASASLVTHTLGGHWNGQYGTAACPVCQPEGRSDQRSLSVGEGSDGKVLLHCFKGGCSYRDIAVAAGLRSRSFAFADPETTLRRAAKRHAEPARLAMLAERLWNESLPIPGTPAETYLRGRGITCDLPVTLRFHPECWHGPTARRWPAMIARVQGAPGFAVHRTFLRPDGSGKAGLPGGDKLMLGSTAGGAVRLAPMSDRLVVAEGIETALSLECGLLEGPATIWAALSASGMLALRLPDGPRRLMTTASDGDLPGRAAAHGLAQRALAAGWKVCMLDPGDGSDFNDVLRGKVLAS